jgi:copper chaperone CopZ
MRYALSALLAVLAPFAAADGPTNLHKHQVTGLFSKVREADLRETFAAIDGVKLVAIDFKTAEITLEYDAAAVFKKAKPEEIVKQLDNKVRGASHRTFGIKPLRTTPADKLTWIEIPVAGLDCKACCLTAYEAINRIDGVEVATASFRDGLVTAWIDPTKTSRDALKAVLKKREVDVK